MPTMQDFVPLAVQFERLAAEAPHPELARAYSSVARKCRDVAALRKRLIAEGVNLHADRRPSSALVGKKNA
jgi:hypothetical protein